MNIGLTMSVLLFNLRTAGQILMKCGMVIMSLEAMLNLHFLISYKQCHHVMGARTSEMRITLVANHTRSRNYGRNLIRRTNFH
jgi:NADH:ubiquinone oxidoreductase subunit K